MDREFEVIKYLTKEVVYGRYKEHLINFLTSTKLEWEKLKFMLLYNELASFLYIILKNNSLSLPFDFLSFLKNVYYRDLFRYIVLFNELLTILDAANKKSILIIPIKGFSIGEEYYKKFGFRPLSDIDLLIKEEELEKGIKLLCELGYEKNFFGAKESYWRNKQCHINFLKRNKNGSILVELHWSLDFKRDNKYALSCLWKRLKKVKIKDKEIFVMAPEDTLFSLALHQRRFGKVFNLKYICDVGIILEKEKLNWEYIIEAAYRERIKASLYFLLYQTQIILDKDLSKYLKKLRISSWHKRLISCVIRKYTKSFITPFNLKYVYTICHFLLYDNILYPIKYVFTVPQEQFAKFYHLPFYTPTTERLYKLRYLYIPYKTVKELLDRKIFKRNFLEKFNSCLFL